MWLECNLSNCVNQIKLCQAERIRAVCWKRDWCWGAEHLHAWFPAYAKSNISATSQSKHRLHRRVFPISRSWTWLTAEPEPEPEPPNVGDNKCLNSWLQRNWGGATRSLSAFPHPTLRKCYGQQKSPRSVLWLGLGSVFRLLFYFHCSAVEGDTLHMNKESPQAAGKQSAAQAE